MTNADDGFDADEEDFDEEDFASDWNNGFFYE